MSEKNSLIRDSITKIPELKEAKITEIIDYICIEIPKEKLIETSKILSDKLGYRLLVDVVGVDRFTKKDRFELIYNMFNIDKKQRLFMRIKLDSKKPEADTVTSIWGTANWQEREVFDMFGIEFKNHPDHRRIYMREDFEYYPLRKDFPLMGIPGSTSLPNK